MHIAAVPLQVIIFYVFIQNIYFLRLMFFSDIGIWFDCRTQYVRSGHGCLRHS
jgi:hypothetical protein